MVGDEYAPTIITIETQDAILDAIAAPRRGAFLALARLGLRPGEVRALNVEDYHDGWLTISKAFKGPNSNAPIRGTKVRKVRRLPVDEELRDWIERYTDPRDRFENVPLFPNPTARNRERRWIWNALAEEWHGACRRVGIRVKLYEGTKHAFASEAVRRGVQLKYVKEFLGHADIRTTERYAKLADQTLVQVLRPLQRGASDKRATRGSGTESEEIRGVRWRGGRDSNPQLPA